MQYFELFLLFSQLPAEVHGEIFIGLAKYRVTRHYFVQPLSNNTAKMSSNDIVLRYFDIKGLAEGIRLLFEEAGIAYKEERFTRDGNNSH